jgi:flagellar hook-associated protein 1
MADLLSILSGASSSLGAQRALLAIASHNIDNASNPGYARQRAEIEALTPAEQLGGAWIGRGAGLTTVTQARDRFLEAQIPQMLGDSGRSTAESDALQAFHALDPQATGGLGDAIAGFYSGLRALAQNPSDPGLRTAFLGQAQVLAQTFNRTAQTVEATRSGLDARVSGLVVAVNVEAAAVAQLNGQIQQASGAGAAPNDLLDLRQQHLDKLAELTGGTPVATSGGAVNVVLAGGAPLVSGNRAGTLVAQADVANGGHLQVRLGPPDGSSVQAISQQALGGTLGGNLAARDGALRKAGDDVDKLAFDLAGQMNAAHQTGFGLDGVTGRPLFTIAAAAPGAARSMTVALTSAAQIGTSSTGAPGDAGAAQALLATESAPLPLSGGADVQSTLSSMISRFGGSAATANAFSEQDGALRDHLVAMRQSYSGVSIDEEMIALQKAQRGYEAVTKVIKTADEMMQTLMQLLP